MGKGDRIKHEFLGSGTIVKTLTLEQTLFLILWDKTPPNDYNTGVNPSSAHIDDINLLGEK